MAPAPVQIGKLLVFAGMILVILGLAFMLGSRSSFFGLGRLPGDIQYKSKNVTLYFPIVTSLVLSVLLTLILWLISALTRK